MKQTTLYITDHRHLRKCYSVQSNPSNCIPVTEQWKYFVDFLSQSRVEYFAHGWIHPPKKKKENEEGEPQDEESMDEFTCKNEESITGWSGKELKWADRFCVHINFWNTQIGCNMNPRVSPPKEEV